MGALRDVLELELAGSLPRVGRFGEGVLVAPLSAAIGLDADVVYVVGLSEDLYPGRLRPDALLPERVRQVSGDELPASRDRLNAKHRHLLAAFAAARVESIASFPRGDLRRSTLRLPSRWLLPSLRELSGDKDLAATAWQRPLTYDGRLAIAGSFAGELLRTSRLATEQEWRTRQAAASGRLDDDVVIAAVQMIRARLADDFTRYDGNLTGVTGLPDYLIERSRRFADRLESYASLPARVLHAASCSACIRSKQPEDIVVISPMEIGNLIHQSVEALVVESADDSARIRRSRGRSRSTSGSWRSLPRRPTSSSGAGSPAIPGCGTASGCALPRTRRGCSPTTTTGGRTSTPRSWPARCRSASRDRRRSRSRSPAVGC